MAKKKTEESGNGNGSPVARASRPAPRRRTAAPAPARGGNGEAHLAPTHSQIAEAAYLRYLNRGAQDGLDFDDWVEAERALQVSRTE